MYIWMQYCVVLIEKITFFLITSFIDKINLHGTYYIAEYIYLALNLHGSNDVICIDVII